MIGLRISAEQCARIGTKNDLQTEEAADGMLAGKRFPRRRHGTVCHIFVMRRLYTRRMFLRFYEDTAVLNRIREMASRSCIANEIDGEEFLMGSEPVLPAEMIRLLSGKSRATHAAVNLGKARLILDEHELALSY